jgi:hypothetical protein
MSRPARFTFLTTLLAFGLTLSGCKTVYSDMYSPKRSRFVPTKVKPAVTTEPQLPPIEATPAPSLLPPPAAGVTPPTPVAPEAAPPAGTIPGL